MKNTFILGYPVKRSLSPRLHTMWLAQFGIEGYYGWMEGPPENPGDFLRGLRKMIKTDYVGCNVTMPYKEAAYTLMDKLSPEATVIGAVNTVVVEEDGSLTGHNTDSFGFCASIREHDPGFVPKNALVLGAGGAAKAIVYGLIEAGCERVFVANRTMKKAKELVKRFGAAVQAIDWDGKENVLGDVDLLVNATSLGMTDQPALIMGLENLPKDVLVADIVCQPEKTQLIKDAEARGNPIVDGYAMLVHQAAASFKLWHGVYPIEEAEGE